MTTIHFENGNSIEYDNVGVKVSGWVKVYDEKTGSGRDAEYHGVKHFPRREIVQIEGEATYESPHGRV